MESNQLTFDFTNNFKVSNNQQALDICEALSYLFCKDGISKINMKIDGKEKLLEKHIIFLQQHVFKTQIKQLIKKYLYY